LSHPDILIPIETSSRELIYKVYLCHQLALKGFHCYLGRKSYINYLIKYLKRYIYIDKGYHKGVSDEIYETIKRNDGIIVSLDEEGGVDYSDGSTLLGRYSKTLFNNSDLTFMWGNNQYELVTNNMNKENKVEVTGHPRFELLKPEFHYLYQDEVDKVKKRYQDFILINTNMGFGNNIKGDDFVTENYGGRFKNLDKIIAFDKKKLEAYRSLIIELSQKLNKTIVLRPHPEEDHSFYFDVFKGRKNIHVVYEGSVVPWILASDLMIHPDCTTAIESLFVGKKPISYLPDNYPIDLVTHLPLEASECFTSKTDLFRYIKDHSLFTDMPKFENYPFLETYFDISSATTELITEKISQLKDSLPNNKQVSLTLKTKAFLKYKTCRLKINRSNSSGLIRNKLKGFNKYEINRLHRKINAHNSSLASVKYQIISDSLFLFLT
tara:strand:- start:855 stop:2165 length:1311 start_codon:yes stop_codon:yes gene_type:complete